MKYIYIFLLIFSSLTFASDSDTLSCYQVNDEQIDKSSIVATFSKNKGGMYPYSINFVNEDMKLLEQFKVGIMFGVTSGSKWGITIGKNGIRKKAKVTYKEMTTLIDSQSEELASYNGLAKVRVETSENISTVKVIKDDVILMECSEILKEDCDC